MCFRFGGEVREENLIEILEGGNKGKKFKPGAIHEKYEFWETLNPSEWVKRVLLHGYHIPFVQFPSNYTERNNKSAREDPQFVEEQIKEWYELGIIEKRTEVTCINPLSVAHRIDGEKIKKRLVIDLSRHVNKLCKKESVKLAHLLKCLEITERNDWQAVLDLEKAYFHIKIAPSHVKFLGFKHMYEGVETVFAFLFLPFGLTSAVHCITKIFKPLVATLHTQGIRYSQFIDDGRVVAKSKEECQNHLAIVYDLLQKCGWQLAVSKSDRVDDVAQKKNYLGFVIDTEKMLVSVEEKKFREKPKTFC